MEFGKLTTQEVEEIDFRLPPDPAVNKIVLEQSKKTLPNIFVGCAKWGRKDWIGKFYPEGTKEKDFLTYYAKLFNCIELNATFYKTPAITQIRNWQDKVGEGFKFCPKFPQFITHIKRLRNCEEEVEEFLKAIVHFENNLGAIFLMPHPQIGPKNFDILKNFIQLLPKDMEFYLELRHPGWYENGLSKELYELAKENNIGLIISDAAGRRDCMHMHLSKPETFIRFVGNGLHRTDYERVDEWCNRLKQWLGEGLQTLYFFMHQHEEIHSPELSKYLVEKLNEVCELNIPVPGLLYQNQ